MKKIKKLAALLLSISACLLASAQAKTGKPIPLAENMVLFNSLPFKAGVDVKVAENLGGKAIVMIFDEYGNLMLKEILQTGKGLDREYIMNRLDSGEYTVEVTVNKRVMKKEVQIHNYQCRLL